MQKGHCPQCGADRNADVMGFQRKVYRDENYWEETEYAILRCKGCEQLYVRRDMWFPDSAMAGADTAFWPTPQKRRMPDWAWKLMLRDTDLHALFRDIYTALDHGLLVFAAIGIRTAFDRASELLEVETHKPFSEKLTELRTKGLISGHQERNLTILTDAGSAAAHRSWRPAEEHVVEMIAILEHFISEQFIFPASAQQLGQNVPPRPKRSE
jgi:hypothetical protein